MVAEGKDERPAAGDVCLNAKALIVPHNQVVSNTREADVAELIARAKEGGSVPERLANIKSPPAIRGRKPCQLYHRSSRRNLVTDRYE